MRNDVWRDLVIVADEAALGVTVLGPEDFIEVGEVNDFFKIAGGNGTLTRLALRLLRLRPIGLALRAAGLSPWERPPRSGGGGSRYCIVQLAVLRIDLVPESLRSWCADRFHVLPFVTADL